MVYKQTTISGPNIGSKKTTRTFSEKTNNHSTAKKINQQTTASIRALNHGTFSLQTPSGQTKKEIRMQIAEEFLLWASEMMQRIDLEDVRRCPLKNITYFRIQRNIYKTEWDNWLSDDPDFRAMVEEGKTRLAAYAFAAAAERFIDSGQVNKVLWQWDPDFKTADAYAAQLKKESQNTAEEWRRAMAQQTKEL